MRFYCGNIGSKWLGAAIGRRTTVQIECPHVIETDRAIPTTEDEELGTDHGCGMVITTIGPETIDHKVGSLAQYWSTKLLSAGVRLDIDRFDVPRLRR